MSLVESMSYSNWIEIEMDTVMKVDHQFSVSLSKKSEHHKRTKHVGI
jgi:hypothetical protein